VSIYKTANFSLITGILGSGKTLRAVEMMDAAVKDGEKVYQSGFKNLAIPGVIDWEDPREWRDLPPGALLFVDEAQKWFGERRAGAAPEYLKAMNTARGNEGVRFVFLTQHPKYLDAHIKDLIGCHEHLLRENGKESSKLWRGNEILEDPRSPRARSKADYEIYNFPVRVYGLFTSSDTGHRIKYRMPAMLKKALIIGGLGALVLGGAWFALFRSAYGSIKPTAGAAEPVSTTSTPAGGAGGQSMKLKTRGEYAKAHLPRFAAMPWSAPIYDQRSVVSDPEIYCASSEAGSDANGEWKEASCTCLTEQSTRYDISQGECRRLAKQGGVYNPYKRQEADRSIPGAGPSPAAMAAPAAAPVRVIGTNAPYGSPPEGSGTFALDPRANPL
jgi:zona occludens toxin